ncbi:MAG TPA: peptidylprolyl isomerase [Candidatus Dormibacteraeota bacterium]|jgi:peptidyl-prolyl cis-trans isomerase A (cyclophilin A)|nr:peptidylprolyl isomerase [Candidatus Dormibacteraeota bacterium]
MKMAKLCSVCVATLLLFGCKAKEPSTEPKPAEAAKTETPAPPPPAPAETKPAAPEATPAPVAAPGPKPGNLLKPSTLQEKAPEKYEVKFVTTRGEFVVQVTRAWSPLGADRFYNLVKGHFYDNTAFFRVVPGFVVQFGIAEKPAVSSAWKHTEITDDPVTQTNKRGSLSFATAGANTRTTQIFINLKDNPRLDGMGFSPFAVVEGNGMNVVEMMYEGYGDNAGPDQDQIEKQGTPYLKKGWPKLDYIVSARIVVP